MVRTRELDALRNLTAQPGARGHLVTVLGEPGSGKTHLLSALVRERQWTALPATVYQCSRNNPERAITAARRLLRRARQFDAAPGCAPAVTTLPRRQRRPARELVVLEDVHLADEQTIHELVDIADGSVPPLVDVVVSLRPRQTPAELTEAIALAGSFRHTEHIELRPLDDEQMLGMSATPPSYELRRRSGGNPFNLRALQALDQSARSGSDAAVAPFEFAVLHETRDLTQNERHVLHAAAILRSRFDVELLAEIADLDALVVSAVLRSLVRSDLIRVEPISTLFSIRDEVFGNLLRRTIDPCWATRAHQRTIHRLSARGMDGPQLGFHLVSSLSRARAGELAKIIDASYEIMETDVTESIFWLTPVLAEAPVTDELGVRARLALSTAFARVGRLAESRELLFVVHESEGAADELALAEQIAFVSVAEGVLSQDVQTIDLLNEQLTKPSLRSTPAWPLLVFARGFRVTMLGRIADLAEITAALEAARGGRNGRDGLIAAGLLALRSLHLTATGEVERAVAALDEAGAMLDRVPEHQVARHLSGLFVTALANVYLGRYVEAEHQIKRAVDIARRGQRPFLLPTLLVLLSEVERHLGLLKQARDAADAAIVESSSGNALRHAQAVAMKSAAEVWAQPVNSGRARALAQQALANQSPSRANVNGSASIAAFTIAQCAWLDGDPSHCVTLLLNDGQGSDLQAVPAAHRPTVWELLCAAGMDAGMPLEEWVRNSQEHARLVPMPHNLAFAELACGHLARVEGRLAEAAQSYQRAAERFASVSMRMDQCYALGQAARALAELGRAGPASDARDLAGEIARRCQAETMIDWLGRQPPEPTPVPLGAAGGELAVFDQLTHREQEIAQLVCAGMKRRDIADRLAISTRTVDVHLTRIYRKAGVRSRMELALAFRTA
ncbi:hypothetical protein GCM10010411_18140 [Actinomadura fulvescens]|uniref:HTH luxR-type domain-containing protein n=1 Tax=Actinomadura fulvescens TaxID=46160 RepID=A0ABP6BYG7_9ACTN